jgi:hypothetical protein
VPECVAEHHPERHHHCHEHEQELIQGALERRARVAEGARLARQPGGIALRANRGDRVGADALDRERPGAHVVARFARDRFRLTGEDRLVDAQRFRLLERAVGDDLVARTDPDEIADDELLHPDDPRLRVADHRRLRRHERAETVECTLRPHLLHGPDGGVGDEHAEEERVLPLPERKCRRAGDREDQVEDREDVGANDARVRAARATLPDRPAGSAARGSLRLGQAAVRQRLRRDGDERAHAPGLPSVVGGTTRCLTGCGKLRRARSIALLCSQVEGRWGAVTIRISSAGKSWSASAIALTGSGSASRPSAWIPAPARQLTQTRSRWVASARAASSSMYHWVAAEPWAGAMISASIGSRAACSRTLAQRLGARHGSSTTTSTR